MTAKKPVKTLNIEFLVPLMVLLVFNVSYCLSTFIPIHDTMFNAQAFHVFYREWFFHGDLAHWIPYGTYGWTSTMEQLAFLSPMSYVVALAGRLLRVTDALLLFKGSVILEQLVLLLGMYLLSRQLFSRRSTVLLVCLGAVGSTVWYAQYHFNFRIFYMFPLVVHLLIRFFETHQSAWLWVAGITTVAWALGNVPYFVAPWLLTLSIIVLVLFSADRKSWRALRARSRGNVLTLTLFTVAVAVYLYQVAKAADFTFLSAGRDATTGAVGIQPFLYHGGRADPGAVLKSLVFGWPSHLPWGSTRDNSIYVGLLCVACFLWAVLRVRTTRFLALAGALAALVWLSFGGFFATVAYYVVPTMDRYRHVGLVYGLAKILFLLCAGFGWEHFWSARSRVRTVLAMLIVMGVLVDALRVVFPFDFYPLTQHGWARLRELLQAGGQLANEEVWPTIFLWRVACVWCSRCWGGPVRAWSSQPMCMGSPCGPRWSSAWCWIWSPTRRWSMPRRPNCLHPTWRILMR
ncbi:MAG: hypothetical protein HYW10_03515 [Candidatus Omnitrophica bacterium]|nr:hypothetical protein [Candidatus Omnitrophota bacterium]